MLYVAVFSSKLLYDSQRYIYGYKTFIKYSHSCVNVVYDNSIFLAWWKITLHDSEVQTFEMCAEPFISSTQNGSLEIGEDVY